MRTHTLIHGQLGFEYRIVEVPAWRHLVAEGTESALAAIGHPCCRWGWAHGLLSRALHVEWGSEKELLSVRLTEEEAERLPERKHFTYLD